MINNMITQRRCMTFGFYILYVLLQQLSINNYYHYTPFYQVAAKDTYLSATRSRPPSNKIVIMMCCRWRRRRQVKIQPASERETMST